MAHLSFFLAGFGLPGLVFVSSIFRDRMSRIKSKNTCAKVKQQKDRLKSRERKGLANRIDHFFIEFFFLRSEGRSGKKEKTKYLIDMFPGFGRSLDVGHSPLLGAVLSFFQRHFPPLAKVAFISDQQE